MLPVLTNYYLIRFVYRYIFIPILLPVALLDHVSRASATVVAWVSIHPSSLNSGFSNIAALIQAKFSEKLPYPPYLQTIFFFFFKIFSFQIFMIFFLLLLLSLTWDPVGAKISKLYSSNMKIWALCFLEVHM